MGTKHVKKGSLSIQACKMTTWGEGGARHNTLKGPLSQWGLVQGSLLPQEPLYHQNASTGDPRVQKSTGSEQ